MGNLQKYFDRHACMTEETMDLIQMCKTELFGIQRADDSARTLGFGSVANMLAGLYDGFDYANDIRNHEEMEVIKNQSPLLHFTIHGILETIDLYPKSHKNEAIY
jgi:hypothetical protein